MPFRCLAVTLACLILASSCKAPKPPASPIETKVDQLAMARTLGQPVDETLRPVLPQSATQVLMKTYAKGRAYWFAQKQKIVTLLTEPQAPMPWTCGFAPDEIPQTTTRPLPTKGKKPAPQQGGDLVNMVLLAPGKAQLVKAFRKAGWSEPNLLEYLQHPFLDINHFPISRLFLWGRKQDVAFSQDTSLDLAHRHHVRFWKSPWHCGASEVWVGTASEDIGVEKNRMGLRSGPTTHLIDPDLDRERNYVLHQLNSRLKVPTGALPRKPQPEPIEGVNGNLDPYVSDGYLGVLDLRPRKF